jgi:hypothetical protein
VHPSRQPHHVSTSRGNCTTTHHPTRPLALEVRPVEASATSIPRAAVCVVSSATSCIPGEPSVAMSLKHSPSSQTSPTVRPSLPSGSETLMHHLNGCCSVPRSQSEIKLSRLFLIVCCCLKRGLTACGCQSSARSRRWEVTPANQGSLATRQPRCCRCIICRSSPFDLLVQSGSIIAFLNFASCAFSFLCARLARSQSFRFCSLFYLRLSRCASLPSFRLRPFLN